MKDIKSGTLVHGKIEKSKQRDKKSGTSNISCTERYICKRVFVLVELKFKLKHESKLFIINEKLQN